MELSRLADEPLVFYTAAVGFVILAVAGLTFGFRLAKPGLGSVVAAATHILKVVE